MAIIRGHSDQASTDKQRSRTSRITQTQFMSITLMARGTSIDFKCPSGERDLVRCQGGPGDRVGLLCIKDARVLPRTGSPSSGPTALFFSPVTSARYDFCRTYDQTWGGFTRGISNSATSANKNYSFDNLPKQVIAQTIPSSDPAERPFLLITGQNAVQDDAAATLNLYVRYFVYDIEQWHHFAANEAIQTR